MQKRGYFAVARCPLPAAVMVAWWCVEWWLSYYPFGILSLQDNSSLYSHKSVGWIKWVISHICTAAAASSKLCGPARQCEEGSAAPPPAPPPCHCGHCWWRRVTSHVRGGCSLSQQPQPQQHNNTLFVDTVAEWLHEHIHFFIGRFVPYSIPIPFWYAQLKLFSLLFFLCVALLDRWYVILIWRYNVPR